MAVGGALPLVLLSHTVPPVLEASARLSHILHQLLIQSVVVGGEYLGQLVEAIAAFEELLYFVALLGGYLSYFFFCHKCLFFKLHFLLPLLTDIKGIKIFDFFDVHFGHELAHLADGSQQAAGGIALGMRHDALLMAWSVQLQRGLAVEPHAPAAVVSVAVAAERRMVEAQQLLVFDVLGVDAVSGVAVIERRAEVVFSVGCQSDILNARVAVVRPREHHTVGQQVQLWSAAFDILLFQHRCPLVEESVVLFQILVGEGLHIGDDHIEPLHLTQQGSDGVAACKQLLFPAPQHTDRTGHIFNIEF